jgi:hypothetical protein
MPLLGAAAIVACLGVGFWVAADYAKRAHREETGAPGYRG